MFGFSSLLATIFLLLAAAVFAFEIWMFVDAVKNRQLSDMERLLWCAGMLLIHPIAAIAYYFLVYGEPNHRA